MLNRLCFCPCHTQDSLITNSEITGVGSLADSEVQFRSDMASAEHASITGVSSPSGVRGQRYCWGISERSPWSWKGFVIGTSKGGANSSILGSFRAQHARGRLFCMCKSFCDLRPSGGVIAPFALSRGFATGLDLCRSDAFHNAQPNEVSMQWTFENNVQNLLLLLLIFKVLLISSVLTKLLSAQLNGLISWITATLLLSQVFVIALSCCIVKRRTLSQGGYLSYWVICEWILIDFYFILFVLLIRFLWVVVLDYPHSYICIVDYFVSFIIFRRSMSRNRRPPYALTVYSLSVCLHVTRELKS